MPGNNPFYEKSLQLWEGLEQDFNFNAMVSQRGVINLFHSDGQRDAYRAARQCHAHSRRRCRDLDQHSLRDMVPFLDFDNGRFPIMGGLHQRRGGTVRHDAVAWGFARGRRHARRRCHPALRGDRHHGAKRAASPALTPARDSSAARRSGWRLPAIQPPWPRWPGWKLPIESHVLQAFVSEGIKPWIDNVVTFGVGHFYISQSDKGGLVFGGDIDGYNSYAQRGNLPMVEHVVNAGWR